MNRIHEHRLFRFACVGIADTLTPMSKRVGPRAAVSLTGVSVLVVIFLGGLYYVKWSPAYQRAFTAAAQHSIGASIVSGKLAAPPAPSVDAAVGYAWAYGKSIWQAMVLGLLLGAGVQALVPRGWLVGVFGSMKFTGVALAGLVSTASMM